MRTLSQSKRGYVSYAPFFAFVTNAYVKRHVLTCPYQSEPSFFTPKTGMSWAGLT